MDEMTKEGINDLHTVRESEKTINGQNDQGHESMTHPLRGETGDR